MKTDWVEVALTPWSAHARRATAHCALIGSMALAVVGVGTGCTKQSASDKPLSPDVVAVVAGTPIRTARLSEFMQARAGGGQTRFSKVSEREALLQDLIAREALYAKAKASGFDQRPEIQESIKSMVIARFKDEELSKRGPMPAVSEQEIQDYFTAHKEQYSIPAKLHGAMIFLRMPVSASDETRSQVLSKAQRAMEEAKAATTPEEFAKIVLAYSEDQGTRYRGGDLGWMTRSAPLWGMEPEVVNALFSLSQPGEFASLVSTSKGIYVLKLLGFQPEGTRPLEQVQDGIRHVLMAEKERKRESDFYAEMKSGLAIQMNRRALETITPSGRTNEIRPPSLPLAVAQTQ